MQTEDPLTDQNQIWHTRLRNAIVTYAKVHNHRFMSFVSLCAEVANFPFVFFLFKFFFISTTRLRLIFMSINQMTQYGPQMYLLDSRWQQILLRVKFPANHRFQSFFAANRKVLKYLAAILIDGSTDERRFHLRPHDLWSENGADEKLGGKVSRG